ncbi:MAG: hypothetical protein JXR73_09735 [Candidatus Omnitrophica bacterium]|nr:hypothetical protein [Candidatus Omnitrophota bacterium]
MSRIKRCGLFVQFMRGFYSNGAAGGAWGRNGDEMATKWGRLVDEMGTAAEIE